MPRALFIQHGETDKPGLLADVLAAKNIALEIQHPYLGDAVPQSLDDYAALAVGGGAQSAYEQKEFPYLADEIALIQDTLKTNKPVIGLCLGAQLLATALGAEVKPNQQKEIGILPVTFYAEAATDTLFRHLPENLSVAHWHGDTFALPDGAVSLAFSALTEQQLFRWGRAWGLQFHLEITPEILDEMLVGSESYLAEHGVNAGELAATGRRVLPEIRPAAWMVFSRWAELI